LLFYYIFLSQECEQDYFFEIGSFREAHFSLLKKKIPPPNLTQSDTTLPNPLKIDKYEQIQVKQGRITVFTACPSNDRFDDS
jgi:hypothetical protein